MLQVSRPGLWFQTVWLYLLPTSQQPEVLSSSRFWLGMTFVCWPLNLLAYGWNDIVDYEIDQLNPRKGSWFFGARGSRDELRRLPLWMALALGPFVAAFAIVDERVAGVVLGMVAVNAVYNAPRHGLRTRPPFELLNQLGYLLILPFSVWLNGMPTLPWATVAYLAMFCTHAHLMGEIMDVDADRQGGRRTTATVIGAAPTKVLVVVLVAAESVFMFLRFEERVLGAFLVLGVLWLLFDLFYYARGRAYTRREYRLLGWGLNGAGFASILWLWWQGSLV